MKVLIFILIFIGTTFYAQGQNFEDHKNIAPAFLKALKSENVDSLGYFFVRVIANDKDLNYLVQNKINLPFPHETDTFAKVAVFYLSKFNSFKKERLDDYSFGSLEFVKYIADTISYDKKIPKLDLKFRIKTDFTEYEISLGEMYKINNSWKISGNMVSTNRFLIRHIKFFKKPLKTKIEMGDSLNKAYLKRVKWFVNPIFDQVNPFSEGMAAVEIDGKCGYIDSTGNIVIPCTYNLCEWFSEDIAVVRKGYRWYFIKKNGDIINKQGYYSKSNYTPNSFFIEERNTLKASNQKYYVIDKKGMAITDSIYDNMFSYTHGFKPVSINKKWGVIDKKGQIRIPIIYDDLRFGSDSNTIIASRNGKYGVLNIKGEIKINFRFHGLYDMEFKDHLVFTAHIDTTRQYGNTYRGLISKKNGEVVISAKYNELRSAFDGSKMIAQKGIGESMKLLDMNENTLFSVENTGISDFGNGNVIANLTKEKQTVEIDSSGKVIKTYPLAPTFYRVNKTHIKLGDELINEKTGKLLIPDYVLTKLNKELEKFFLYDNISKKWGLVKFSELPSLP